MSSKLLILFVAAVAVTTAVPQNTQDVTITSRPNYNSVSYFDCRGLQNGNYNHPWDCTRYISCISGTAYDRACPDCPIGPPPFCESLQYLVFNFSFNLCDFPSRTPCNTTEIVISSTEKPTERPTIPDNSTESTLIPEPEVWPCHGRKAGDECDPQDCKLCGYCNNTASYYFWCRRVIPDDPKLPVTGEIVHSECDKDLWWDPEMTAEVGFEAGACTRWEDLSLDVQKSYKEDEKCIAHRTFCDWSQDEDQVCTKNYWYKEDIYLPPRTDHSCDSDLIWDNSTKTCRSCDNVPGCETRDGDCTPVNSTTPVVPPDPVHPCTDFSYSPFDCLASSLRCAYCHYDKLNGSRCDLAENLIINGCTSEKQCPNGREVVVPSFKLNPETPTYTTSKISLCLNQTLKFNVTFTLDEVALPLDLYVLLDLSGSMSDDKENIVRLSSELIALGTHLSSDFQIGFGTHVDKQNVSGRVSDYSFWNHLSLTSNYSDFENAVRTRPIGGGGDEPESQLEGLFQASACVDQIKWRSNSRRLLLLLTDASYHEAGDTKLHAFNGSCSLDATGKYTLENVLDYPSETQIINIMKANQIVPIFAVVPSSRRHYTNLSQLITPSGLANLTSDSSNILQVLDEQYDEITSNIEVNQEGPGDRGLEIKFNSKCNGEIDQSTNKCENLRDQLEVSFGIQMAFKSCPTNKNQTVRIRAAGMPLYFDALLEIIC